MAVLLVWSLPVTRFHPLLPSRVCSVSAPLSLSVCDWAGRVGDVTATWRVLAREQSVVDSWAREQCELGRSRSLSIARSEE